MSTQVQALEQEQVIEWFTVATRPCGVSFDDTHSATTMVFAYPPPSNEEEREFCENTTLFMFPHGYSSSAKEEAITPPPMHNLFALTDEHGDHLYGASLSFFETYNGKPHCAKSICVLSRRPFYTPLLRYLEQLLLVGVMQSRMDFGGDLAISSVEKCLCNLFHEVPVPYRGLAVQVQIAELEVVLDRPLLHDFPFEMDMELMMCAFSTVDAKTLLQLYHHVLLEHRVLVVGNDAVLITAIVETLKSLLFPMTWLHVFIPSVPDALDLSTLLEAPVPFLAGAHAAQLKKVVIPSNVILFDTSDGRIAASQPTTTTATTTKEPLIDGVALPPLPEAFASFLQTISTIHIPDLALQRKELHRKLWERRVQIQQHCMAASSPTTGTTPQPITPKTYFLSRPTLVYKKMMKLYLDMIAGYLQDLTCYIHPHTKQFDREKFVDRRPSGTHAFFEALARTAHFQLLISQYSDYVNGELDPEDAATTHYLHNTLLSDCKSNNQAENGASSPLPTLSTKTFVAHVPESGVPGGLTPVADGVPSGENHTNRVSTDITFPMLHTERFGTPRKIVFPAIPIDATDVSLGTLANGSLRRSSQATKNGTDWIQNFIKSIQFPSPTKRQQAPRVSSAKASGERLSVLQRLGTSASFKRSRTIDRIRNASPFRRTLSQDSTDASSSPVSVDSLASSRSMAAAASSRSRSLESTKNTPWLLTTSPCACHGSILRLTQDLKDAQEIHPPTTKQVTSAFCALIHALEPCGHVTEAKTVFEECLHRGGNTKLASIATIPHLWAPFSALVRCYIVNGLLPRALDLLAQVQIELEDLLDPSQGSLQFAAQVLNVDKEIAVERVQVTFSCGNLGMCLAPRYAKTLRGCELVKFQESDAAAAMERDRGKCDLQRVTGLQRHDVVESINGRHVLDDPFSEIIATLKQASRPVTIAFLRGLGQLTRASTLHAKPAALEPSRESLLVKPRNDLCDRFGLLPRHGIRVTTLADCFDCGTRASMTEICRGWSSDANDYTTRCAACSRRFVPRLCVVLGVSTGLSDAASATQAGSILAPLESATATTTKVEQYEYLSMPVLLKELRNLSQRLPLALLAMRDLREMNPRIYWNAVVKLLALAEPLSFLELPDMTRIQHPSKSSTAGDTPPPPGLRDVGLHQLQDALATKLADSDPATLDQVLVSLASQVRARWSEPPPEDADASNDSRSMRDAEDKSVVESDADSISPDRIGIISTSDDADDDDCSTRTCSMSEWIARS